MRNGADGDDRAAGRGVWFAIERILRKAEMPGVSCACGGVVSGPAPSVPRESSREVVVPLPVGLPIRVHAWQYGALRAFLHSLTPTDPRTWPDAIRSEMRRLGVRN